MVCKHKRVLRQVKIGEGRGEERELFSFNSFCMENSASNPTLKKPGDAAGTSPGSASVTKMTEVLVFFSDKHLDKLANARLIWKSLFTTTGTILFDGEKHYKQAFCGMSYLIIGWCQQPPDPAPGPTRKSCEHTQLLTAQFLAPPVRLLLLHYLHLEHPNCCSTTHHQ